MRWRSYSHLPFWRNFGWDIAIFIAGNRRHWIGCAIGARAIPTHSLIRGLKPTSTTARHLGGEIKFKENRRGGPRDFN